MAFLPDDLWCHPVRSASHGPKDKRTWTWSVSGHVETKLLGAAEVNELDHAVGHQHYVAALYVSETWKNKHRVAVVL